MKRLQDVPDVSDVQPKGGGSGDRPQPNQTADESTHLNKWRNRAPQFPDPNNQPDTVFHGGSGSNLPPSDDGKRATSKGAVYGHDDFGSEDNTVGELNSRVAAHQPPPVKSKASAPVRQDLK